MVANSYLYELATRADNFQSEEMQQQAIEVSQTAFEKFSIEKDIAQYIKKEVTVASLQRTEFCCAD